MILHTGALLARHRKSTSSSGMADRQCDCLCTKSPLCNCQHCQWFCSGWDVVAICRARITRPKRHLPNAHEILVTWNDQFCTGVGHFWRIFEGRGREGASPTNQCWCQKTRVIAVSCGIKISAVHHLVLSQYTRVTDSRTDKQMDRRNCESNTVHCITCSRTVKTVLLHWTHCHNGSHWSCPLLSCMSQFHITQHTSTRTWHERRDYRPCMNSNNLLTTVLRKRQWARRKRGYCPTTYIMFDAMIALLSLPRFCSQSPSSSWHHTAHSVTETIWLTYKSSMHAVSHSNEVSQYIQKALLMQRNHASILSVETV